MEPAIPRSDVSRPRKTKRTAPPPPAEIRVVMDALADRKAQDVVVLDLRGLSNAADFFVIASGTSDTHVRAVAEHVAEALELAGARVHHAEGLTQGRWALLDVVDIVVHVFHPSQRDFYQLERLWGDAPRLALTAS